MHGSLPLCVPVSVRLVLVRCAVNDCAVASARYRVSDHLAEVQVPQPVEAEFGVRWYFAIKGSPGYLR